jgi:hypothetical protein
MARRILRKFVLEYIAGVDRPAVAGATARIMKSAAGAHIGDSKLDTSKVDLGALAAIVLEGATASLLKAEPTLTKEQAFAKVFTSQQYRLAAEVEREAAHKRLVAGVSQARTAPVVLQDLSDDEVRSIADGIQEANPFISQAELFRLVGVTIQERQARRAPTTRRPMNSVDNRGEPTGKSDAYGALTQKAAELRKANPDLSEAQAFAAAYSAPANRELAKAERLASRAALNS